MLITLVTLITLESHVNIPFSYNNPYGPYVNNHYTNLKKPYGTHGNNSYGNDPHRNDQLFVYVFICIHVCIHTYNINVHITYITILYVYFILYYTFIYIILIKDMKNRQRMANETPLWRVGSKLILVGSQNATLNGRD
jgi:hypothetical protein